MTSQSYDVIVAGIGAMGSAIWRRGLELIGLGHDVGSSPFDLSLFSLGRVSA